MMNHQELWGKISNHPSVCTCTDCQRWRVVEDQLTAQAEAAVYGHDEEHVVNGVVPPRICCPGYSWVLASDGNGSLVPMCANCGRDWGDLL